MSETSTLISCNGKVTRAELMKVPTPPATKTHIPIPHLAVVEGLVETLSRRHIGVIDEGFAVSTDGMEMFGVIDLETRFDGCRFAIGIRNANNKRFRLSCTVSLTRQLVRFYLHTICPVSVRFRFRRRMPPWFCVSSDEHAPSSSARWESGHLASWARFPREGGSR
jgi:hypothetical protein